MNTQDYINTISQDNYNNLYGAACMVRKIWCEHEYGPDGLDIFSVCVDDPHWSDIRSAFKHLSYKDRCCIHYIYDNEYLGHQRLFATNLVTEKTVLEDLFHGKPRPFRATYTAI